MRFPTQFNGKHRVLPEINNLPSETIPDQSMSIQEIARRFAVGLPVDGQRVGLYDYDENDSPTDSFGISDISHLDLAEREEMLRESREEVERLKVQLNQKQAQIKAQNAAKAKAAAEKAATAQTKEPETPKTGT